MDKPELGQCWEWQQAIGSDGYGRKWDGNRMALAHRWVYELLVPIPEGLHLDHLCGTRSCVNPDHLEPVTQAENNRRSPPMAHIVKTACPQGHPYDPTLSQWGGRKCRPCHLKANREYARR